MKIGLFSTMICTDKMQEVKDFYIKNFGAKLAFDSEWYKILEFSSPNQSLHLMASKPEFPAANGQGLCLNMQVDDVDAEYKRLMDNKCTIAMPIEDHDWGDRGFSILDPGGVSVYIYTPKPPSEEFAKCYKS